MQHKNIIIIIFIIIIIIPFHATVPSSHSCTLSPLTLPRTLSSPCTLQRTATFGMSSSTRWMCSVQLPSLSLNLSKPQDMFICCRRNFIFAVFSVMFCSSLSIPHSLTLQPTNSMQQHSSSAETKTFFNSLTQSPFFTFSMA